MYFRRPDPGQINFSKDRQRFKLALKQAILAAIFIWSIMLFTQLSGFNLIPLGLYPRSFNGLIGVVFAPLIHSGWAHLFNNTLPLIIGLLTALYTYPEASKRALPVIYFGSSALAWVFARPSFHIGASGFIFGILAFVFISGLLRRDMRAIAVSMVIWFMYASMIWGVLPIRAGTSWEMHLSGAIIGVFMAISLRNLDAVAVKRYSWEDEENDIDDTDWQSQSESPNQDGEIK